MNTKDRLYNLIHSMSPNEKGYFKKFVASDQDGKAKKYLQVFELFDKQKAYSKTDLEKKFEKKGIGGDLNSIRNYLYKLVLKSLRMYKEGYVRVYLFSCIQSAYILEERGLFRESQKELQKAKKLSIEIGQYGVTLSIIIRETYLLSKLMGISTELENLKRLNDEHKKFVESQEHVMDLRSIHTKTKQFQNSKHKLKRRDFKELKFLKKLNNAALPIRIMAYFEEGMIYHYLCEDEQVVQVQKKINALLQENPGFSTSLGPSMNLHRHILDIGTSMNGFNPSEEDFENVMKLRNNISSRIKSVIPYELYNCLLLVHILIINSCKHSPIMYEKIREYELEIEENIKAVRNCLIEPQNLYVLFAVQAEYHFFSGNYHKSAQKSEKVIHYKDAQSRMKNAMWCVYLLSHYELGNWLFLQSAIRSFYRILQSRKEDVFQTGRLLISLLRRSLSVVDSDAKNNLYIATRDEMIRIKMQDFWESSMIQNLRLIEWLTAKIENKPLLEVLKEKRD